MGYKACSDEVSDGMRNMLLDNGEKVINFIKMTKNSAQLCSCFSVLWKVELVRNENACLTEVISKQSVEGEAWCLLIACNIM